MRVSCSSCHEKLDSFFFTNPQAYLCASCLDLLSELTPDFENGQSLFRYTGLIRDLILKAKVHANLRSLECIIELCINHELTQQEAKICQQVAPIPSSFIGRLKGQYDLAYFLASEISRAYNKEFIDRWYLGSWGIYKRSVEVDRDPLPLNFPQVDRSIPTLLVDDVVTSGFSLLNFSKKLPKAQCRFLTIASAYTGSVASD